MANTGTPYPFDPRFEDALVTMCCSSSRLWAAIGKEIDPDLLNSAPAQLAMKAARDVAFTSGGEGPSSTIVVCQRLKQWEHKGNVTHEDIMEVLDLFDDAEDSGLPTEEQVIEEAKPILKERILREATQTAITQQGKQGDFGVVAKMINKAENLGLIVQESLGTLLDTGAFAEIERIRNLERASTGIPDLDAEMLGGPERGSLTLFIGGTGDGKSMVLNQVACEDLLNTKNVAVATLELNKAWWFARVIANITGMPINRILNGSLHEAQKAIKKLKKQMGQLRLEYFTPGLTTIDDIIDWVNRIEKEDGIRYEAVVVDYGDKLAVPSKRKSSTYMDMLEVFEKFRIWVTKEERWGYTASQAKRRDKNQKKYSIHDGADSQHKARVAQIIITLNVSGDEITFFIGKNTNGVSDISVGPLPMDLGCARIVEVYRAYENNPDPQEDLFS